MIIIVLKFIMMYMGMELFVLVFFFRVINVEDFFLVLLEYRDFLVRNIMYSFNERDILFFYVNYVIKIILSC